MKIDRIKKSRNVILTRGLTLSCFTLIAATYFRPADGNDVPYPEGYRSWAHVKTALIQKGSPAFVHWGGFHHIYGNAKAIDGYKAGKFDDGSILVFDVLEATSRDSVVSEGKRRLIDVMVKDAQKFKTTGGWGYEEFAGDSKTDRRIGAMAVTSCYNCHAQQKANDNVFSGLRN
ncbi:MAG TPA: cytochrome P460 family protein [Mucilaginibacter sp.]|jgi:hypothetical protein